MTPPSPVIALAGVTKTYPGAQPVHALRGIDLEVSAGESLAITGSSGSGKSTLLSILGLLDRPTAGEYRFEGVATAELDDGARTRLRGGAIGFVFQAFHLLPTRTVLENVLLAASYAGTPRNERVDRAHAALERVHLAHRAAFRPVDLSGGERQRAAIARAVSVEPRVLLADEPTGNLDRENAESVMTLFDELHTDGLTIVTITHDPTIAARSQRRVRIDAGVLTAA